MAHTPGTWVVSGTAIHDRETNYDERGARIGETAMRIAKTEIMAVPGQQEANAQFIVTACNAHDKLLAACKESLDTLIDTLRDAYNAPDQMIDQHPTVKLLRAAIKKGEG
jgi:hypothetical protein